MKVGANLASEAAGDIPRPVQDAARLGEPDRYLAATLASRERRPALAAIAAFAAELARIPATVSEPALGDIRLQWWRDVIGAEGDTGRTGHPVGDAIVDAIQRNSLRTELLLGMIDAREFDLSGGLPQDDAGLATYLDRCEGNAFRLALATVAAPEPVGDRIARSAGIAYGLARSLGRLPMLLHNGGLPLPAERLRAANIEPDALGRQPRSAVIATGIRIVVGDLAIWARRELASARAEIAELPRSMRTPLLPLVMVEPYLRSLSDDKLLDDMTEVWPLGRVIRIGLAHVTGQP